MEFSQGIPISENEVLKWNTPKDELFNMGSPRLSVSGTFARWENVSLFENDLVNITANFESENPSGKLEYVRVECPEIEESEQAGAPRKIFEVYTKRLRQLYGVPTKEETYMNYPIHTWKFSNHEIILGIAERFMEYSIFVIKLCAP